MDLLTKWKKILVVAAVPYHTVIVFTSRGGRLVQLSTYVNESSKESRNQSNSSIKNNSRCVDADLTLN